MKKIAFCFLIYDVINQENIWHLFFKNIDKNKYNIYIHYKWDKPLQHLEKYKLKNCIPTEYGHITIVDAYNLMIKEGLKDPDTSHFIFLSGSCIPLKSFEHVYSFLDEKYSYFNVAPQSQCFPRQRYALKFVNRKFLQKSSNWYILNRKHAEIVVYNTVYLKWFQPQNSPEEHAHLTYLYYAGLDYEIVKSDNSPTEATTFTNWSDMNYKYPSMRGIKNYEFISQEELSYLLSKPCLFGRKFNKECNLQDYDFYVKNMSPIYEFWSWDGIN